MEMKIEEKMGQEQLRKIYVDNMQGYVFMAKMENKELLITENGIDKKCKAKDFWDMLGINVMDISFENDSFEKCNYINEELVLEYDNRIIRIKTAK